MNILMAATEMEPFAQTGGLGEVIGALPRALATEGHQVSVALPLYRVIKREKYNLVPFGKSRAVPVSDREEKFRVYRTARGPVKVYFIDKPDLFDRDWLYGYSSGDYTDNAKRFVFFSRSVVDLASRLRPKPHVIHIHDWQTALVTVYLATLYKDDPRLSKMISVFTIHNIGYQGLFLKMDMQLTGLNGSLFTPEGLEFYNRLNLLKGGIIYSDVVTTVSPRHAEEIQTEEYGCGLQDLLRRHRGKLFGIINGVDSQVWNPATDPLLPCNYSPADLSGKVRCKQALQEEMGLPLIQETPVIGMVTRLAEQKGIDLLASSIEELMKLDLQIVLLGQGDKLYEELIQGLCRRFPDSFACRIEFDKRLSHLLQAGCDFSLMPSHYEPCGLSQIYSLRYGTIPIVRATGGLDDTVIDIRKNPRRGTGFKFKKYSSRALVKTVAEAMDFFHHRPDQWQRMIANAFAADFGWIHSARRYLELYRNTYKKKFGRYPPGPRSTRAG